MRFSQTFSLVKKRSSRPNSPRVSPEQSPRLAPSIEAKLSFHTESSDRISSTANLLSLAPRADHNLVFHMSEAFLPKLQEDTAYIPEESRKKVTGDIDSKMSNRPDSGQDSFFHVYLKSGDKMGSIALGVADGVGGWVTVGVDPSEYSQTLCNVMVDRFLQQQNDPPDVPLVEPSALISHAYDKIRNESLVRAGSCTACVGIASPITGLLQVANVGDSGYSIFRQGRLHGRSQSLTHRFNTPYQLAVIPDDIEYKNVKRIDDKPSDALITTHTLQHGDVVVFATDGMTDNLFSHEVLKIVTDIMIKTSSWKIGKDGQIEPAEDMSGSAELAVSLVRNAALHSMDVYKPTPFSQELKREVGITAYGGKPDDITVVCLLVQNATGSKS